MRCGALLKSEEFNPHVKERLNSIRNYTTLSMSDRLTLISKLLRQDTTI
jgi:hypothetical protein